QSSGRSSQNTVDLTSLPVENELETSSRNRLETPLRASQRSSSKRARSRTLQQVKQSDELERRKQLVEVQAQEIEVARRLLELEKDKWEFEQRKKNEGT
ncbi:MAG: hypothetical protein M1823_004578, partial [Watsoniomyces obsoletus]